MIKFIDMLKLYLFSFIAIIRSTQRPSFTFQCECLAAEEILDPLSSKSIRKLSYAEWVKIGCPPLADFHGTLTYVMQIG